MDSFDGLVMFCCPVCMCWFTSVKLVCPTGKERVHQAHCTIRWLCNKSCLLEAFILNLVENVVFITARCVTFIGIFCGQRDISSQQIHGENVKQVHCVVVCSGQTTPICFDMRYFAYLGSKFYFMLREEWLAFIDVFDTWAMDNKAIVGWFWPCYL